MSEQPIQAAAGAVPVAFAVTETEAKVPTAQSRKKAAAADGGSQGTLHAIQSLLYILVVALFIISFNVQPFRIPSESMEPTLLVGDFLLVAKQDFPSPKQSFLLPSTSVRRGDIIIFHYPIDSSIHLVKRVIGLPGDRLRLRNGRVFIDEHALNEPYAIYSPGPSDNFRDNFPRLQNPDPDVAANWWIQMKTLVNRGELTVPPGCYFVLGDNRNDSEDSRYWGFVPAAAIVGKPLLIYLSLREKSRDEPETGADDPEDSSPEARGPALPHRATRQGYHMPEIFNFARWDRTLRIVR